MSDIKKMFKTWKGTKEAFIAAGHDVTYSNNLVWIEGGADGAGKCLYTHGIYVSDITEIEALIAAAKSEAIAEVRGDAATDTKESKTIEGVIKYVDDKTSGIASDATVQALGERITNEAPVTMTETDGTGDILKTYTFTQNGKEIGKINLAKELVVTAGQIVEENGVKYLELTIANQTEKVRIAVTDLVDVYTAGDYITIGANNTISVNKAEIIDGLATTDNVATAKSEAVASAKEYADGTFVKSADYATDKTKLDGIAEGAQVNVIEAVEVNGVAATISGKKASVTVDAYTKAETDNLLGAKANAADVYAKTETYSQAETNGLLADKANAADVYTQAEVDAMFEWEVIQ